MKEEQLEEKIKMIAVLQERCRIMREFDQAALPISVWVLIKDIVNPVNK